MTIQTRLELPEPERSTRRRAPHEGSRTRATAIPRSPEVQEFIQQHHGLDEFLETAAKQVTRYFGRDARLRLELVTFPDSGYKRLYLFAKTDDLAHDITALDRLDDEWLLDAQPNDDLELTVGIDFGGR